MTLIPPSEEIQKKIKEQLYQEPAITAQDIRSLKEWISKQPHLPQDQDDIWLERVLYGCKYSVERCKKILDKFYTIRSALPQYFIHTDPSSPEQRQISETFYRFVLPEYTPEGYRVAMCGLLNDDVSKFDLDTVLTREVVFYSTFINIEPCVGYISVYDMKNFTMSHLTKAIPQMNNISLFMRDCMPIRVKQVHYINATSIAKNLMTVLTPLLKEKVRNRIQVHTADSDTLYNSIPKKMLPAEFGGEAGTIKELNDAWQKKLESMRDWIVNEFQKKTDESKRPKGSMKSDLFGTDGNFKTLNVD